MGEDIVPSDEWAQPEATRWGKNAWAWIALALLIVTLILVVPTIGTGATWLRDNPPAPAPVSQTPDYYIAGMLTHLAGDPAQA